MMNTTQPDISDVTISVDDVKISHSDSECICNTTYIPFKGLPGIISVSEGSPSSIYLRKLSETGETVDISSVQNDQCQTSYVKFTECTEHGKCDGVCKFLFDVADEMC